MAIACLFMAGGAAYFVRFLFHPFHTSEEHEIVYSLERGDSLRDVAHNLTQNYHLRAPYFFIVLAMVKGVARDLQAGEYAFSSSISASSLLSLFVKGEVKQHRLTLIPGWTFQEAREAIRQAPFLTHTIESIEEKTNIQEGLLFPDTYFFTKGTSDLEVLKKAHHTLQVHLQKFWETRSRLVPYQTPYEGLILASLVEKETARDDERAKIAGVFIRRLKKNMKLESDPTVIFGLGERYKGVLLKRDLTHSSPYNTYLHNGLPPTPIALVSLAALQAAFSPEDGTALYFVANRKGGHYFSNTWHEHDKAIRQYRWKKDAS